MSTRAIPRLVGCLLAPMALARAATLPPPVPCPACWSPPLVTSWQWQLTNPVDTAVNAAMYDIDLFDNSAEVVGALHGAGRKVICYLDAGSWENWRPDQEAFPPAVLGKKYIGFPDERWLDIRRLDVLGPLMEARLELCRSKGFDGVEFDNVDGYQNPTGFPLTADDQLAYDVWLANQAHARGLNAALKNDADQVPDLVHYFDWALVEQCFQYQFCDQLMPFIQTGKAVMAAEYQGSARRFCRKANARNFNGMKKHVALDAWRIPCR